MLSPPHRPTYRWKNTLKERQTWTRPAVCKDIWAPLSLLFFCLLVFNTNSWKAFFLFQNDDLWLLLKCKLLEVIFTWTLAVSNVVHKRLLWLTKELLETSQKRSRFLSVCTKTDASTNFKDRRERALLKSVLSRRSTTLHKTLRDSKVLPSFRGTLVLCLIFVIPVEDLAELLVLPGREDRTAKSFVLLNTLHLY